MKVSGYTVNLIFLVIGLLIVGFSTGWNIVALLGAFVASIHITVRVEAVPDATVKK